MWDKYQSLNSWLASCTKKMVPRNYFLAPKNHFQDGLSAFSVQNHIKFGQLPIRSTRWMEIYCLVCDTEYISLNFLKGNKMTQEKHFQGSFSTFFQMKSLRILPNTNQELQMDEHMLFNMRHDYIPLNLRKDKNGTKKSFFGAKKSPSRRFFHFILLQSHRIRPITNKEHQMDGDMLFDMRHDYISLNFQKEIKGRRKSLLGRFFCYFQIELLQIRPNTSQEHWMDKDMMFYMRHGYIVLFFLNFGAKNHFLMLKKAQFLDLSRVYLYEIVSK